MRYELLAYARDMRMTLRDLAEIAYQEFFGVRIPNAGLAVDIPLLRGAVPFRGTSSHFCILSGSDTEWSGEWSICRDAGSSLGRDGSQCTGSKI